MEMVSMQYDGDAWRGGGARSALPLERGTIVTDDPRRADPARRAALAMGLHLDRTLNCEQALSELITWGDGIVVAELGDEAAPYDFALLHELDGRAIDARRPAVVSFPLSRLDEVASVVSSRNVSLLCDPTTADRVAAIELARFASGGKVAAGDEQTDAMKIQQLADDVARIARALAGLAEPSETPRIEAVSDGLIGYRAGPAAAERTTIVQPVRADDIRAMIRLRRRREALFAGDLFADPAWDMMLDLMAARIERLRVAVSSLCIAAAVPATTALRWIRTLTDLGVLVRVADPTDGRRVFIELSETAATLVLQLLGEAKAEGTAMI